MAVIGYCYHVEHYNSSTDLSHSWQCVHFDHLPPILSSPHSATGHHISDLSFCKFDWMVGLGSIYK